LFPFIAFTLKDGADHYNLIDIKRGELQGSSAEHFHLAFGLAEVHIGLYAVVYPVQLWRLVDRNDKKMEP
jgi:hypothetical protein